MMSINNDQEALKRRTRPVDLIVKGEIATALSETKRKPSSHGAAAHKVRNRLEDRELLKILLSDDISELKEMLDEL
jgi:hypothetical protein